MQRYKPGTIVKLEPDSYERYENLVDKELVVTNYKKNDYIVYERDDPSKKEYTINMFELIPAFYGEPYNSIDDVQIGDEVLDVDSAIKTLTNSKPTKGWYILEKFGDFVGVGPEKDGNMDPLRASLKYSNYVKLSPSSSSSSSSNTEPESTSSSSSSSSKTEPEPESTSSSSSSSSSKTEPESTSSSSSSSSSKTEPEPEPEQESTSSSSTCAIFKVGDKVKLKSGKTGRVVKVTAKQIQVKLDDETEVIKQCSQKTVTKIGGRRYKTYRKKKFRRQTHKRI